MTHSKSSIPTKIPETDTSLTAESRAWLVGQLNKNFNQPLFEPQHIIKVPKDQGEFDLYAINPNVVLGKGSNSTIYEAYKISIDGNLEASTPIAIKAVKSLSQKETVETEIVNESQHTERLQTVEGLKRESQALKKMSIGLGDHVQDEAGDYLIMPLYSGEKLGDNSAESKGRYQIKLSKIVSDAPLADKASLLSQLGGQLKKLHDNQLMHGDLHIANILVGRDDHGKLSANIIDLDQSRSIPNKDEVVQADDVNMAFFIKAPEVMHKKIGAPSDIYALGLNYLFILGHPDPFIPDSKISRTQIIKKYIETDLYKNSIEEYKKSPEYATAMEESKNSSAHRAAIEEFKNSAEYKNSSDYENAMKEYKKSSNSPNLSALDPEAKVLSNYTIFLKKRDLTDEYLDQESLKYRKPIEIGELDSLPIEIDGIPLRAVVKNFIGSMLNDDASARPTIDDVNQFMLGVEALSQLPAEKINNSDNAKNKWDDALKDNPGKMVELNQRILEQGYKQALKNQPEKISAPTLQSSPIPQEYQEMYREKLAILLTEMKNASQQVNQQRGFINKASRLLSRKGNATTFEKNLKGVADLYNAETEKNPKETYEKIMISLLNEKAALEKKSDQKNNQVKILNQIIIKASTVDRPERKKGLKDEFSQSVHNMTSRLSK